MQQDKYTDFDLELRSMLEDAEEQVPSGVWEALSEELDRRDRRKVVTLWWRRAAVGIGAAAAALACILALPDRGSADIQVQTPSYIADDTSASSEAREDNTIEEQISRSGLDMLADLPSAPASPVKPVAPSAVTSPEEIMAAEEPETTVVDSTPAEQTSAVQPKDETTKQEVRKESTWNEDPFEKLAREEEMAKKGDRGVALFMEGNAATNDKNSDGLIPPRRQSSSNNTSEGISEKSISTYGVPLSFGLGAKFQVSDRVALGTGINYSLLSRSFTGIYTDASGSHSINSDINNEIHYIGIPLNLYYNIISSPDMKFYVWGGGSIEKGLVDKYRIYSKPENIIYKRSVDGVQLSSAIGLGLEFTLTDKLGLYIDPSARYYFDCNQPNSVRTAKPFMLNFEVGLRFNLLER